ncbi:hypothetical protein FB567DRAFT_440012 [Paraphoma chrysanthemicola]|uniref:Uncharacterized protein n=1 Tax=Paraphoma chrysanthemicola TaxID=798071 RepID=A0A8K0R7U8_9PLEO|nr:hypothetical protein FB567DRAFT_440012 [Paraphoma chrysanthemicola]
MLHYQNDGISYQENSARFQANRASFASLPGELRNLTYASTLRWASPISITYNTVTKRFHAPNIKRTTGRTPLEALELLSDLDHNIRCEARSYFFANNTFQVETSQTFTTDADYIKTYITFLENIGEIGRRSLRWLRLTVSADSKQHRPTLDKGLKLWSLIADCFNLLTLDIYAEIDYFYMDQQAAMKQFMTTEGSPISKPWSILLEAMHNLSCLHRLVLRPVFSSRWRYFDISIDGKLSTPPYPHSVEGGLSEIRFRMRRPYDEAAALSAQVKGGIRRGLRGTVGVRVLTTETWEHYGADVIFEHDNDTDEWKSCFCGRCKPYGRSFNYSNALREN